MRRRFHDRADAGIELASLLGGYRGVDGVVLGLPRGGVAVAAPVARALDLPLDAYVVRKLGVPGHEELAMGAIATGGVVVWNEDVVGSLRISAARRQAVVDQERTELERRERAYRGDRGPLVVRDRVMVVVDDGLATGATMAAAVAALKTEAPASIVVAVPVAPSAAIQALAPMVDDVVAVVVPERFGAVGAWYDDFRATSDDDVIALLRGDRGD
ncbi:MAG TPA: phosphoribosyltransferase family protein [Acidimicrobiales bacterium]|nr:phosphoribosyltransferase family protein [Acidimicrobiales bacterium]